MFTMTNEMWTDYWWKIISTKGSVIFIHKEFIGVLNSALHTERVWTFGLHPWNVYWFTYLFIIMIVYRQYHMLCVKSWKHIQSTLEYPSNQTILKINLPIFSILYIQTLLKHLWCNLIRQSTALAIFYWFGIKAIWKTLLQTKNRRNWNQNN